ncbi:MAG: DUF3747 domain-containing protein [Synechococcus sp.]
MLRSLLNTWAFVVAGATLVPLLGQAASAQGSLFTALPVDEANFILVAAPIGQGDSSQLNIYEQRNSKRSCFAVSGSAPAVVDPLLATFDFTGVCNRYIDGNGYSLRVGGDDLGTRYRLSVVKTNQDVELVAVPTREPFGRTHVVARAGGAGDGFLKLELEPGWSLMRRHYGQRALGHLYVFREVWPASTSALEQPLQSDPEAAGGGDGDASSVRSSGTMGL